MSEVQRYYVGKYGLVEGEALGRLSVVLAADFDNANRLFLDAAERCIASERREKELQALLTAADERANVMETALAGMLFAFDDGVGRDWSAPLLDFARKLTTAKEFKAALKPAEGNGSTCNQIREETGLPINRPCKACNDSACIDR